MIVDSHECSKYPNTPYLAIGIAVVVTMMHSETKVALLEALYLEDSERGASTMKDLKLSHQL